MSSSEYVENSVLFFLYDKVDVINQEDLICICASFYSDEEVREAKRILYRLLRRDGDLIERRADARKKNLSDMLSLLTTETITDVKFCVTNTRRLPPVAIDHIDAAALLKNVMETSP